MSTPHALAWSAWLAAVTGVAVMITNPLFTATSIGAVVVVWLSRPPDDTPAGRAARSFLLLGTGLLAVRLVFLSLVAHQGPTALLELPRLELPRWLGGFGLGGTVTGEVLAEGASEGLRLVLVLLAFGVLNAAVDFSALVRLLPGAFRDTGLVVSIALAFVPGLLRTAREVADAQRLRGVRGLRIAGPSTIVPILGITLERAFLLAESMDARGYGRATAAGPASVPLLAGTAAVAAGLVAWVAGAQRLGSIACLAGTSVVAAAIAVSARRSRRPRIDRHRWTVRETAMVACAGAAILLAAAAGDSLSWTAYPRLSTPPFDLASAAGPLLLAGPALLQRRRA